MNKRKIPVLFPDGSLNNIANDLIYTDPLGSYTGLVDSKDEKPVQDADDL